MQNSSRWVGWLLAAVAVVSVGLNVWVLTTRRSELAATAEQQPAYRLYIVIPNDVTNTDDYIHRLETLLADRASGFTMYPTRGGGLVNGQMVYQTTLVCELYGIESTVVTQIAREIMASFGVPTVPVATSLAGWQILQ